ncbi:MAG: hypothetical protein M1835_003817, partial [Candelina submexicana]
MAMARIMDGCTETTWPTGIAAPYSDYNQVEDLWHYDVLQMAKTTCSNRHLHIRARDMQITIRINHALAGCFRNA